jgi:hypothetical protein
MEKLEQVRKGIEILGMGGSMRVFLVVFTFLSLMVTPALTDDGIITVSCYQGDPVTGNYVGNLTVPSPESAAQKCNALYFGCGGKCTGCFSDFDLTEDVCYDSKGRRFLK